MHERNLVSVIFVIWQGSLRFDADQGMSGKLGILFGYSP